MPLYAHQYVALVGPRVGSNPVIFVPEAFASELVRESGEAARHWLEALPALVEQLCERWGVELVEGHAPRGDWNLVFFARRADDPCVLKLSYPQQSALDEMRALAAWGGQGAVGLLEASPDDGALLLERLDDGRSLRALDLFAAAEVAGDLIRRLTIPAPPGLRRLADLAEETAETVRSRQRTLGHPLPAHWVEHAAELATGLASDVGADLVHGDLHYDNVLAGTRQPWSAIDPKPVTGNPERSVPELMWGRIDDTAHSGEVHTLLAILVDAGNLDHDRARAWTIVRAVDYWLWGLGASLTEDPVRCRRLLEVLA